GRRHDPGAVPGPGSRGFHQAGPDTGDRGRPDGGAGHPGGDRPVPAGPRHPGRGVRRGGRPGRVAVDPRPDRRYQELCPGHPGLGHVHRSPARGRGRGWGGLRAGARPSVVGRPGPRSVRGRPADPGLRRGRPGRRAAQLRQRQELRGLRAGGAVPEPGPPLLADPRPGRLLVPRPGGRGGGRRRRRARGVAVGRRRRAGDRGGGRRPLHRPGWCRPPRRGQCGLHQRAAPRRGPGRTVAL
ncbi:MAG: Histidinol-phosphatase [alternative form], partial [uncultured Acidimicrobiales bacterium]